MKVLYVSDSYFPSRAANSVHVMKMCEALAGNGHEVFLMGMTNSDYSPEKLTSYYGVNNNFTFVLNRILPIKGALWVHALLNLLKVRKIGPDFVFGRSYLSIALIAVMFPTISMSFETHNPIYALNRIQRWSFFKILRKAKSIVVISDALKQILQQELNGSYKIGKISVHHDGATIPVQQLKSLSPFSSSNLKVGYIGTIQKGRGIEQIVQLCNELPQIEFHIIGGTMDDLKDKIGIKTAPMNLFIHGYQTPALTQDFRDNLDILLAPYQENTMIKSGLNTSQYMSPLKIFEYMASAKPIIASDLPVIREILNGGNSILVLPDDLQGWKEAIVQLSDPGKRNQIAEKALSDLKGNYTWELRAKRILDEVKYQNLVH